MDVTDSTPAKEIEKNEDEQIRKTLFNLLKIISAGNEVLAKRASKQLLRILRKVEVAFESFDPNPKLLQELNFGRLLVADEEQDRELFDLMVFINRYFKGISFKDYNLGSFLEAKLRKEEMSRLWTSYEHVISKVEKTQEKLKERGVNFFVNNF